MGDPASPSPAPVFSTVENAARHPAESGKKLSSTEQWFPKADRATRPSRKNGRLNIGPAPSDKPAPPCAVTADRPAARAPFQSAQPPPRTRDAAKNRMWP